MPLLSISYVNFRNIQNETIDLLSKEVFFVGENGQGKSNLLESVYYLAYGSSFRTHSDSEIIRSGENAFSLRTLFKRSEDNADSVFISLENAKKRFDKLTSEELKTIGYSDDFGTLLNILADK